MKAVPLQNYVLCELISSDEEVVDKGIAIKKENLKQYKIISTSDTLDDSRFTVGDIVICNSTGTKFNLEDKELYLFKLENIAGKLDQ